MNKAILILVAFATILTACNSNQAGNGKDVEENQQSVKTEVVQENTKVNLPEEVDQNQTKESVNQDEWSSLPEYDSIVQQIDKEDYTFKTVTDNEGKRILLLIDQEGKEQYKSIFIKNTSRLKIIKFDGEGEIFNDILNNQ